MARRLVNEHRTNRSVCPLTSVTPERSDSNSEYKKAPAHSTWEWARACPQHPRDVTSFGDARARTVAGLLWEAGQRTTDPRNGVDRKTTHWCDGSV